MKLIMNKCYRKQELNINDDESLKQHAKIIIGKPPVNTPQQDPHFSGPAQPTSTVII